MNTSVALFPVPSLIFLFLLVTCQVSLAQPGPVVPGSAWINVTNAVQRLGDFGPFEVRSGRGFVNRCTRGIEAITGAQMSICVASVGSAVLRITARVESDELAADVASGFFGLLASLPYKDAKPQASRDWAERTTLMIRPGAEAYRRTGDVRFRIARASVRMLTFELQHYKLAL